MMGMESDISVTVTESNTSMTGTESDTSVTVMESDTGVMVIENNTSMTVMENDASVIVHRQPTLIYQLFARGMNLVRVQSGTWSSRFSNSRGHRIWFTPVRVAVWSNIIHVFYNKKWSCDHRGGFV